MAREEEARKGTTTTKGGTTAETEEVGITTTTGMVEEAAAILLKTGAEGTETETETAEATPTRVRGGTREGTDIIGAPLQKDMQDTNHRSTEAITMRGTVKLLKNSPIATATTTATTTLPKIVMTSRTKLHPMWTLSARPSMLSWKGLQQSRSERGTSKKKRRLFQTRRQAPRLSQQLLVATPMTWQEENRCWVVVVSIQRMSDSNNLPVTCMISHRNGIISRPRVEGLQVKPYTSCHRTSITSSWTMRRSKACLLHRD
jgi:hypothetical protein